MRLPVRRARGAVEFLEPGYDLETGIFTSATVAYPMDWPLDKGLAWFRKFNQAYPWAWPDEARPALEVNRSYSVHLAACLGTYCRAMFPPGTPRPMMLYVSNQAGVGKSTLVAQALIPVNGSAETAKTPKDDDRMAAELETVARSLKSYLFFDDIGGKLLSAPLNRFVTSAWHTGRIYGQNLAMFSVPNVTQVYGTATRIMTTPDLSRRSLTAEFFLATEASARTFSRTITPALLARREVRKGFLAAACALVKHWIERGAPAFPDAMPSFELWSETITGILTAAGFTNPLARAEMLHGTVAVAGEEMGLLLCSVASDVKFEQKFTRADLVSKARELGLLEDLVGSANDAPQVLPSSIRFGRQLQRFRDRELVDNRGRSFRVALLHTKTGAAYVLNILAMKPSHRTHNAQSLDNQVL